MTDKSPKYATVEMVRESAYGIDIPDEVNEEIAALIVKAERRLLARVKSIPVRIKDGRLSEEVVGDVVTDMVLRVVRNPEGMTSEQAEGFGYRVDWGAASGRIHVTKEDLLHLGIGARGHALGNIRVSTPSWRLPGA